MLAIPAVIAMLALTLAVLWWDHIAEWRMKRRVWRRIQRRLEEIEKRRAA